MGNAQSKPPGSNGGSGPTSPTVPKRKDTREGHSQHNRRRESVYSTAASTNNDPSLDSLPTSYSTNSRQSPVTHQPSPSLDVALHTHHHHKMGNQQSIEDSGAAEKPGIDRQRSQRGPPPHSVRIPTGPHDRRVRETEAELEAAGPPRDPNFIPYANLNFPPRLPLPIEEEVFTPGSPIITQTDLAQALDDEDLEGTIPHRTSLLSHTTLDEDEGDYDGYGLGVSKGQCVPTVVEWRQGGERVYITGSFTAWSKKYRMHKDPVTGIHRVTVELPPGTHHVKFIVDGEMQLSKQLPTAVDYTNILVNYIEVSADDIPHPSDERKREPSADVETLKQLGATGVSAHDHEPASLTQQPQVEEERPVEILHYGSEVPRYLLDLDREESSNRFKRAAASVSNIPTPPSLPLFLNKSILNGTTPMKDDNSVLAVPNHTVLNHLATSSIKNGILATSVTTRIHRKHVTTITFRPTSLED